MTKEKLSNDNYNILCQNCYKTCKENVIMKSKIEIDIGKNGLCKICNCYYKYHSYVDYIIKGFETKKEEINIENLRETMQTGNIKIHNSKILKSFFENEIFKLRKQFLLILLDIKNTMDEINKIALNINDFETKEQYLKSLCKKNKTSYQELYEINQILNYINKGKFKNIDDFLNLKQIN